MILEVQELRKDYGNDNILKNINLKVKRNERVALIGPNGAGKTTLLKCILGAEEPTTGRILLPQGERIGYLSQHHHFNDESTVWEIISENANEYTNIENELNKIEKELESNPSDNLFDKYSALLERKELLESNNNTYQIPIVLKKLGFTEEMYNLPARKLSGGQKTRLLLAKLIIECPSLLILDEPTNHIDIDTLEWLETWCKEYSGAILFVSHDRYFLENVATAIAEIRDNTIAFYDTNYNHYLQLREEEFERLEKTIEQQHEEIEKKEEYVRRFIAGERSKQAKGRRRHLERMKENALENLEEREWKQIQFKEIQRSSDIVVECKNLSFGFDNNILVKNLNWTVRWQERWGIVGANGLGKSTLIKNIFENNKSLAGNIKQGSNLQLGYFAQDHFSSAFDNDALEKSPLNWLADVCDLTNQAARDILGKFLISGDDVFRPITSLSGGERNKLVLAKLYVENPNLLVLDEPTNHLDINSREVLINALNDYQGTLIIVSHDRWLLNKVTNHTLAFEDNKTTMQYPGKWEEYYNHKNSKQETTPEVKSKTVSNTPKAPSQFSGLSPREISKKIRDTEKLSQDLLSNIQEWETKISDIQNEMSSGKDNLDFRQLGIEIAAAEKEYNTIMQKWEKNEQELEELKDLQ